MQNKTNSKRIRRDLTDDEQSRLDAARADAEANREAIVAEGRVRKAVSEKMKRQVREAVEMLRAQRNKCGVTLAEIEERSGLKTSALSRLENNEDPNPTLLTLHRYANAIGVTLNLTID